MYRFEVGDKLQVTAFGRGQPKLNRYNVGGNKIKLLKKLNLYFFLSLYNNGFRFDKILP